MNDGKNLCFSLCTLFMQNLGFAYMKDKMEKNYVHINLELGISKKLSLNFMHYCVLSHENKRQTFVFI
jgi:hypothetical protein